jgi:hypothetical protein
MTPSRSSLYFTRALRSSPSRDASSASAARSRFCRFAATRNSSHRRGARRLPGLSECALGPYLRAVLGISRIDLCAQMRFGFERPRPASQSASHRGRRPRGLARAGYFRARSASLITSHTLAEPEPPAIPRRRRAQSTPPPLRTLAPKSRERRRTFTRTHSASRSCVSWQCAGQLSVGL